MRIASRVLAAEARGFVMASSFHCAAMRRYEETLPRVCVTR